MPHQRRHDDDSEALRSDERRPRSQAVQAVVDRQFGKQTDPPAELEIDRIARRHGLGDG